MATEGNQFSLTPSSRARGAIPVDLLGSLGTPESHRGEALTRIGDADLLALLAGRDIEQIQNVVLSLPHQRVTRLMAASGSLKMRIDIAVERNRYEQAICHCQPTFRPPWHCRGPNHYTVLGVPALASAEQITSSFRRLTRLYHPDLLGDEPETQVAESKQRLVSILRAGAVLRDAHARRAYDLAMGIRPSGWPRLFESAWFPAQPWYSNDEP